MLNNLFRINLPYGFSKNENGEWMAFNREYMPLGFNNVDSQGSFGNEYDDLPIYTKYKGLTDKLIKSIIKSPENIHYNESGEITKFFLYSDNSNPSDYGISSEYWNIYFNKLKKLSVISKLKD